MQANELIRNIVNKKINDIHTSLPAKIERYDPNKMIADIVLLAKKENSEGEMEEISPVIECPVAHYKANDFIIRPPYKKGDRVQVVFSERALDKLLITGEPENPQFKRRFSYDDAIITNGLKIEQEADYPDEEKESLYIANLAKDVKIFINPDGTLRIANDKKQTEIVIESDGILRLKDMGNGTELKFDVSSGDAIFTLATKLLLGSAGASEGVPLGNTLKDWLDNHTHKGVSAGTSVSGKPNSTSPNPSQKVFVE